ncbi:MAG TPA: phosphoribosylformylglycinamidine synthase subunit PurQ [Nitrospiraceae bacterium]|jgi:phosphoribosylformylglycinamidine synthase|nr:phosphoribosylformylglycinamidine synthase subunit PurQ [Nitrospiraceae bacterium]
MSTPSRVGILVFPGSNCDRDCHYAVTEVLGAHADFVWHKEPTLPQVDAVIIPGGFSYGDYLRTGAIARFSPVMASVSRFAEAGGLVLGICNGFQILLEAGLLPGAMLRNRSLSFVCKDVHLRVENADTPFTRRCKPGQVLTLPIAHGEGNYYADQATLSALKSQNQLVFRYCTQAGKVTPEANPNGSLDNIAGITNAAGNVLGMMPHPERCADVLLGNEDGRLILLSLLEAIKRGRHAPKPVLAS